MRKYTQRELKNLVRIGAAQDLTGYGFQELKEFLHSGVYGLNGGLLQDTKTGQLYAITARNTALCMAF